MVACFHPRFPMDLLWMDIPLMTSLSSVTAPFTKENDSGRNPTLTTILCQNFYMDTFMYKNSRPPPRPGVGSWRLWILSLLQEHHHHSFTTCWKPCGSHMSMLSFQFGGQLACCMYRLTTSSLELHYFKLSTYMPTPISMPDHIRRLRLLSLSSPPGTYAYAPRGEGRWYFRTFRGCADRFRQ